MCAAQGKVGCDPSPRQLGGDVSLHRELESAWEISAYMETRNRLAACLQEQVGRVWMHTRAWSRWMRQTVAMQWRGQLRDRWFRSLVYLAGS